MSYPFIHTVLLLPTRHDVGVPCPVVAEQYERPVSVRLCDMPPKFKQQIVENGQCIDCNGKCIPREHYPEDMDAMAEAFAANNQLRRVYAC